LADWKINNYFQNMNKTILAVLFFVLASFPLLGQESKLQIVRKWTSSILPSDYKKDFIVLASGEQVFGTIVRNYNYADFDEVSFEMAGKVTNYLPQEIQGFGLDNGQVFLSKPLPGTVEPVFVQILVSGPIQLGEFKGAYFLDNGKDYEKLEAYFPDIERNGPAYKKISRPYKGTLKRFLSGDCGVALYPSVDRASYNDQVLIRILSAYFQCNQEDFQVHIEKIPFIRVSPVIGLGLTQYGLNASLRSEERIDRLDRPFGPQVFFGIRFHDSRRVPRLSSDVRLVISTFQTEVLSSFEGSQAIRTGSEDLTERAISIPFSLNYSLLKRPNAEIYMGAFFALWQPTISQAKGIVDERILGRNEVFIYESPITQYQGTNVYSGARLGGSLVIREKLKVFAEIEGSVQPEFYKFSLLQNDSFYDRSRLSFQLGIEL